MRNFLQKLVRLLETQDPAKTLYSEKDRTTAVVCALAVLSPSEPNREADKAVEVYKRTLLETELKQELQRAARTIAITRRPRALCSKESRAVRAAKFDWTNQTLELETDTPLSSTGRLFFHELVWGSLRVEFVAPAITTHVLLHFGKRHSVLPTLKNIKSGVNNKKASAKLLSVGVFAFAEAERLLQVLERVQSFSFFPVFVTPSLHFNALEVPVATLLSSVFTTYLSDLLSPEQFALVWALLQPGTDGHFFSAVDAAAGSGRKRLLLALLNTLYIYYTQLAVSGSGKENPRFLVVGASDQYLDELVQLFLALELVDNFGGRFLPTHTRLGTATRSPPHLRSSYLEEQPQNYFAKHGGPELAERIATLEAEERGILCRLAEVQEAVRAGYPAHAELCQIKDELKKTVVALQRLQLVAAQPFAQVKETLKQSFLCSAEVLFCTKDQFVETNNIDFLFVVETEEFSEAELFALFSPALQKAVLLYTQGSPHKNDFNRRFREAGLFQSLNVSFRHSVPIFAFLRLLEKRLDIVVPSLTNKCAGLVFTQNEDDSCEHFETVWARQGKETVGARSVDVFVQNKSEFALFLANKVASLFAFLHAKQVAVFSVCVVAVPVTTAALRAEFKNVSQFPFDNCGNYFFVEPEQEQSGAFTLSFCVPGELAGKEFDALIFFFASEDGVIPREAVRKTLYKSRFLLWLVVDSALEKTLANDKLLGTFLAHRTAYTEAVENGPTDTAKPESVLKNKKIRIDLDELIN